MAVEGVNNSNNNAGLYALGAAAIGGGTGAGVAYMTKPFLKDGAPTDSFTKKIEENVISGALKEEDKKILEALKKTISDFEAVKDIEGLKTYVKNDELIKKATGLMGENVDELVKGIDELGFEKVKDTIHNRMIAGIKEQKQVFDDSIKFAFENSWDANKGKFVHNKDKISLESFNAVKKAARSIQGKYALIYGSIAAGVLGIGTYLATMGNKGSAPEQKILQN